MWSSALLRLTYQTIIGSTPVKNLEYSAESVSQRDNLTTEPEWIRKEEGLESV